MAFKGKIKGGKRVRSQKQDKNSKSTKNSSKGTKPMKKGSKGY